MNQSPMKIQDEMSYRFPKLPSIKRYEANNY